MPPTRTHQPHHYFNMPPYSRPKERQQGELQQNDDQFLFHQDSLRVDRDPAIPTAVDANAFALQLHKDGRYVFTDPLQSYDPLGLHHIPLPPESRLWRPNPVARGDREEEPLPFNAPMLENPLFDSNFCAFYPSIGVENHKGFFRGEDEEWTCYRRNYFAMTCSWGAANDKGLEIKHHDPYLVLEKETHTYHPINAFTMNITARVFDDPLKPIALVQHTPKRDKGPVNTPTYIPLGPTALWQIRYGASRFSPGSGAQGTGQQSQTTHFERLQFKKATANNGKRRAAQQHYEIEISLCAGMKDSLGLMHYIKIASRKSHRIVVRGRSPGHYHKDRPIEKEDQRFSGGRPLNQGLVQHQFATVPGFGRKHRFSYPDAGYSQILSQSALFTNSLVSPHEDTLESADDDNDDQVSNTDAPSPRTVESEDGVDGYQFFPAPVSQNHNMADSSSKLPAPGRSVNMPRNLDVSREQSALAGKDNVSPFSADALSQYSRPNHSEAEGFQPCHATATATRLRSGYADLDNSMNADYGLQPAIPTAV